MPEPEKFLCPACNSEASADSFQSLNGVGDDFQWYEAPAGRMRLVSELMAIDKRGFTGVATSLLPDRRLVFRFPFREGAGETKHLVMITQKDHPLSEPHIVLTSSNTITNPQQRDSELARRLDDAVERYRSSCKESAQLAPVAVCFELFCDPSSTGQNDVPRSANWYESAEGRLRLSAEISALRNARVDFDSRLLPSGELAFVMDGNILRREGTLVAVFPQAYPAVSAALISGSESLQCSRPIDPAHPPFLEAAPLLADLILSRRGDDS